MEWREQAVVLSGRRHGETALILTVMTEGHGRHAGLVRGGGGRASRGLYQPGNHIACSWRARLASHLGTFTAESVKPRAADLLDDAARLAALSSTCALLDALVPEREPHPGIYHGLIALLDTLTAGEASSEDWGAAYVGWEVGVLRELGFGLDFSACAATGVTKDLRWVSPRTGRAVSETAGFPYRDRLLVLPEFLVGTGPSDKAAIVDGLRLTGHFLGSHGLHDGATSLPAARDRLVALFSRNHSISGG